MVPSCCDIKTMTNMINVINVIKSQSNQTLFFVIIENLGISSYRASLSSGAIINVAPANMACWPMFWDGIIGSNIRNGAPGTPRPLCSCCRMLLRHVAHVSPLKSAMTVQVESETIRNLSEWNLWVFKVSNFLCLHPENSSQNVVEANCKTLKLQLRGAAVVELLRRQRPGWISF